MKKAYLIALFDLLFSVTLVSCGGISKDKAVDIALKSIGTSKVYVQKWEVELDKSTSPAVYKVTTWREGKYIISVDSKSGEVVKTDYFPEN